MLFSANLFLAEIDRPELLTRGFSNYYVVRALGLPAFLGYSANQTYAANKERSKASEADLKPVEEYIQQHYAKPNPEYFGMAKAVMSSTFIGKFPAILDRLQVESRRERI